jgi:hypothetical protein
MASAQASIGDIIEIETPRGRAYAQYSHRHPDYGQLLRVLPGLHGERPNVGRLAAGEERFFVFYPLDAALARDPLVEVVGRADVPDPEFPELRAGSWDADSGEESWYVVTDEVSRHVGRLTPELRRLSTADMVNHKTLLDRITSGWSPQDWPPEGYLDRGGEDDDAASVEPDSPLPTAFYAYLPSEQAAQRVARQLRGEKLDVVVSETREGGAWRVLARAESDAEDREMLEEAIAAVVEQAGGEYDGHEVELGG